MLQVWILCNDCNDTTEVFFHIIGQKCSHCRSYNTRTIAPPVLPQWIQSHSFCQIILLAQVPRKLGPARASNRKRDSFIASSQLVFLFFFIDPFRIIDSDTFLIGYSSSNYVELKPNLIFFVFLPSKESRITYKQKSPYKSSPLV